MKLQTRLDTTKQEDSQDVKTERVFIVRTFDEDVAKQVMELESEDGQTTVTENTNPEETFDLLERSKGPQLNLSKALSTKSLKSNARLILKDGE